jgi:hypothetical protein
LTVLRSTGAWAVDGIKGWRASDAGLSAFRSWSLSSTALAVAVRACVRLFIDLIDLQQKQQYLKIGALQQYRKQMMIPTSTISAMTDKIVYMMSRSGSIAMLRRVVVIDVCLADNGRFSIWAWMMGFWLPGQLSLSLWAGTDLFLPFPFSFLVAG